MIQYGWLFLVSRFRPLTPQSRFDAFHFAVPPYFPRIEKQNSRHRGSALLRFCNELCLSGRSLETETPA